ncbi:MAG: hypothetical protein K2F79_00515, partial [Muribaculaceae bacterium]|nr:hypothetical protein [Muribaculaceae bacterium]
SRPGDNLDIHAFYTRNDIARIRMLFETEPSLSTASIIVGPEDGPALDVIAELAAENGTYVFNVLNFRDTAYVHNPYILQANIPQREMYQTAVRGLRAHFEGYTPVILRSTVNPNDKEAFVNVLAESYRADGIEPVIIEYQGNLLSADMESLAANPAARYMIIPSGGSLQEFNKVAYVLRAFRDRMIASASENGMVSPDRNVAIVGIPTGPPSEARLSTSFTNSRRRYTHASSTTSLASKPKT